MRAISLEAKVIKKLNKLGISVDNSALLTLENSVSVLTVEEFSIFFKFASWNLISKCSGLSEEFIEKFADRLNWKEISKHQDLSEEMILKYKSLLYMPYVAKYQKLSDEMKRRLHIIEIPSERKMGLVKYVTI